jgi:hypothetical protein
MKKFEKLASPSQRYPSCGSYGKYILDRIDPQGVKIDIFYKGTTCYLE